jgi:hypothetical protein
MSAVRVVWLGFSGFLDRLPTFMENEGQHRERGNWVRPPPVCSQNSSATCDELIVDMLALEDHEPAIHPQVPPRYQSWCASACAKYLKSKETEIGGCGFESRSPRHKSL